MGIMNKMRDSMKVIMITVAALFIIYIVMEWGMGYLGWKGEVGDPVIGKVNGQEIKLSEFNRVVNNARENQKAQTGQEIDDEQMESFRQQVWDAYVSQILLEQQIKKWDIKVTPAEIDNIMFSENPPEFLKRNFIDSTGKFNRQAYDRALRDPRNAAPVAQAKEIIKQQQIQEKLQAVINSGVVITETDILNKFKEQNLRAEARFVLFDMNTIKNDDIKVSDEEIKNYYNQNLDKYKQEAQRKLKYIIFREQPSKSDTDFVFKSAARYAEEARTVPDFAKLVKSLSSKPYSEQAIRPGSLPKPAETQLFKAGPGSIVGPLATYEGVAIFKVIRDSSIKEEFVSASHILVSFSKTNNDTTQALNKTRDLLRRIKAGEDFAKLAKENSDDPGSAQNGGDLGTFGKGMMVPEFEKAAFGARAGEIVGPVKTTYGYHIIRSNGKITKIPIVAELLLPIKITSQTREDIYNAAKDFEYMVTKGNQTFEKEAELLKLNVQETSAFNNKSDFVPGIGLSPSLVAFAFENDLNDISDVKRISGGYVIAKVSEVINDGVKKFEEVKESIKPLVINQKKLEILFQKAQNLRKKIKQSDSLSVVSQFEPSLIVTQTGSFNYGQFIGGGVGRDFAFNFTAFKLKVGEISEPIKGDRGVYIIQLVSKIDLDRKGFESQRPALRSQLLQEKKQNAFSLFLAELKKKAEIKDYRDKYFR